MGKLLSYLGLIVSSYMLSSCFICCTIDEGVSKQECENTALLSMAVAAADNSPQARASLPVLAMVFALCSDQP